MREKTMIGQLDERPTHCECTDHADPDYCCTCGHFHSQCTECTEPSEQCGDYRCCVNG